MPRNRSAGIVIKDGHILLMRRVNHGKEYFTFAGGGVDEGETPEAAVVREFDEETTLVVKPLKLLYRITWDSGDQNYFYLCEYVSGVPQLHPDSEELEEMKKGVQVFDPLWVEIKRLPTLLLYQLEIRDLLVEDIKNGFGEGTKELKIKVDERRRTA